MSGTSTSSLRHEHQRILDMLKAGREDYVRSKADTARISDVHALLLEHLKR